MFDSKNVTSTLYHSVVSYAHVRDNNKCFWQEKGTKIMKNDLDPHTGKIGYTVRTV